MGSSPSRRLLLLGSLLLLLLHSASPNPLDCNTPNVRMLRELGQLELPESTWHTPAFRAFVNHCGNRDYTLDYYVDIHMYLIVTPSALDPSYRANREKKDALCNEAIVLHDSGGFGNVLEFPDKEFFKARRKEDWYRLSDSLKLQKLLDSFYQAASMKDGNNVNNVDGDSSHGYDVIDNNCATFVLSMMDHLELPLPESMLEYTVRQLIQNQDAVTWLRSNNHIRDVLEHHVFSMGDLDHVGDEQLLSLSIDRYVANKDMCMLSSYHQEEGDKDNEDVHEQNIDKKTLAARYHEILSSEALPKLWKKYSRKTAHDSSSNAAHQTDEEERHLQNVGSCSLCANGDTPMLLENTIESFVYERISCIDAVSRFPAAFEENSIDCTLAQVAGRAFCGCPEFPPISNDIACDLCHTQPTYDINLSRVFEEVPPVLPEESFTCFDELALSAVQYPEDRCEDLAGSASFFCGCPDAPQPPRCTLCTLGDNDPSYIPDKDCEMVQGLLDQDITTYCTAAQSTAGIYCGCRNPIPDDTFRICGGNTLLPDPLKPLDLTFDFQGRTLPFNTTCGYMEFEANAFTFQDSGDYVIYADLCGCNSAENGKKGKKKKDSKKDSKKGDKTDKKKAKDEDR